jgi:UDP:flavonoid glycosyltransferase YjiC (YdhE family)
MTRRIVLSSVGSFGDLHPFIALGAELKARGFEAVLAAAEEYRGKAEAAGLEFHPVAPSTDQLLSGSGLSSRDAVNRLASTGATFIVREVLMPYLEQSFAEHAAALEGADLAVCSNFAFGARLAAEALGTPTATVLLAPCTFFSAAEPAYYMEAPWLPALRRGLGRRAAKLVLDLGKMRLRRQTPEMNRMRRRLGLPIPRGDEVVDGPLRADAIIALHSPLLGGPPPDAPRGSVVAGFTFYDSETGQAPGLAPELESFLQAGEPPLVFSLGSLGVYAPGAFYEDSVEAARRLGRRAVLLTGPEAYARLEPLAGDDVAVARYAPHSLIFPRAAAVIHHGGIGTVGQAMRAGRPQLVCPMLGDQLDNAERLKRLGIAERLDHGRYSAARAADLLRGLLDRPEVAAAAARVAEAVRQEDGAGVAADVLERLLEARPRAARDTREPAFG